MAGLPLVGDEFAGYRVRAVLGRGGMSVVYQAENLRLSSVIALKVLAPELAADDVFRARFLEESRIAASLNHPNVIPIFDMGSQDDLLFERGSDEADPDHVYLADFGITKHAMSRSGLTSTGQFLGTIDYVAPEQIRGTSVLGLADQYSLGCVLYECLTGRVPFEKDLDAAIIFAHVEESPTMPTVLRPDLPPAVDEVFGRVLAKQPGERYGSCREFIEAARVALGGLAAAPAVAPPTSIPSDVTPPAFTPAGLTPAGLTPAGLTPAGLTPPPESADGVPAGTPTGRARQG